MVRISGGNDKQGFPMKQGILTTNRVRLLLSKGHSCYRVRRAGERRRKSVRGCIVDASLSVINLVVIKKGMTYLEYNLPCKTCLSKSEMMIFNTIFQLILCAESIFPSDRLGKH